RSERSAARLRTGAAPLMSDGAERAGLELQPVHRVVALLAALLLGGVLVLRRRRRALVAHLFLLLAAARRRRRARALGQVGGVDDDVLRLALVRAGLLHLFANDAVDDVVVDVRALPVLGV